MVTEMKPGHQLTKRKKQYYKAKLFSLTEHISQNGIRQIKQEHETKVSERHGSTATETKLNKPFPIDLLQPTQAMFQCQVTFNLALLTSVYHECLWFIVIFIYVSRIKK